MLSEPPLTAAAPGATDTDNPNCPSQFDGEIVLDNIWNDPIRIWNVPIRRRRVVGDISKSEAAALRALQPRWAAFGAHTLRPPSRAASGSLQPISPWPGPPATRTRAFERSREFHNEQGCQRRRSRRRIQDGAVVTVSSSSALGCPDLVLKAIGDRFEAEGHPRDITALHPIAAGDMYGVKGMDYIARDGLLKKVLAGSYPSGPSSLPMPEIWKMIVEDRVAAYNLPSGVMFDMHREAAAHRPGVLTKVGLKTFVDPVREGCAMNARGEADPMSIGSSSPATPGCTSPTSILMSASCAPPPPTNGET
ncbi:MAG: CoA-transferase [Paracoccaceae bacterium]